MEPRKIILFGKSAFCITLPQAWVKKNKLQKGDTLGVQETQRNSLEIIPSSNISPPEEQSITIEIEGRSNHEISHLLLSAYLNGYSKIVLHGPNAEKESFIREQVKRYIATEVMETSPNNVTIQVFWDIANIEFDAIMTRIGHICKNLFLESFELLEEKVGIDEIKEKGREAQKQILLARRVINYALNNSATAQRFNLSSLELLYNSYIIYFFGKTAEHTVKISKIMHDNKIHNQDNSKTVKTLEDLMQQAIDYYDRVIETYNKRDRSQHVMNDYMPFENAVNQFFWEEHNQAWVPVVVEYIKMLVRKIKEAEFMMISMDYAPKYG